jgi:transposase
LEVFEMADKSVRYAPEFKRQMVDLVLRGGRSPASLAKEFGPTAWTIALWVRQAKRDGGKGDGGLTTPEREELARLRSENRKLKEEREILSKAAAWFATESGTSKRSSGS